MFSACLRPSRPNPMIPSLTLSTRAPSQTLHPAGIRTPFPASSRRSHIQHYLEGVLFVMCCDFERLMDLVQGKMMSVERGKVVASTNTIHEANSPLGKVFRSSSAGNRQSPPDRLPDFNRDLSPD